MGARLVSAREACVSTACAVSRRSKNLGNGTNTQLAVHHDHITRLELYLFFSVCSLQEY